MTGNRRLFAAGTLLAACVVFAFPKTGLGQTEGQETQVITLKNVTAPEMVRVLKDLYGSDMKITADEFQGAAGHMVAALKKSAEPNSPDTSTKAE